MVDDGSARAINRRLFSLRGFGPRSTLWLIRLVFCFHSTVDSAFFPPNRGVDFYFILLPAKSRSRASRQIEESISILSTLHCHCHFPIPFYEFTLHSLASSSLNQTHICFRRYQFYPLPCWHGLHAMRTWTAARRRRRRSRLFHPTHHHHHHRVGPFLDMCNIERRWRQQSSPPAPPPLLFHWRPSLHFPKRRLLTRMCVPSVAASVAVAAAVQSENNGNLS